MTISFLSHVNIWAINKGTTSLMNSQELITNSSKHNATASEVKKSSHLGFCYSDMMLRHKKKTKSVVSIPNYSLYEFVEQLPIFAETDRVPE